MITRKTGSGKLHTILAYVHELIDRDVNILVASPTGFLSNVLRAEVSDHVTCDKVHTGFHITVNSSEPPSTSWSLLRFDLVIIEKVSLICESIFNIIITLTENTS